MNRRAILQLGAASLAAGALSRTASAQTPRGPAATSPPPPPPPRFYLDACSRNLQWRRSPEELGKAVLDLGLSSVDLNIAAYPGHVDPARAATELPRFVQGLRAGGVAVRAVTTPIRAADAGAEAIIAAAAASGVGYYTWSGLPYDEAKPFAPQMDELKARLVALAKLNQKHGVKGLYQPRPGDAGALFVDLLPAMQASDPRWMGFRYDTSLLQASPQNVVRHLKMGRAYIGGVALSDAAVDLEFPRWRQGRFTDAPELLTRPNGGGDNTGNAGGDWLAYGGGGRPLPYHYRPKPIGTGMIDLIVIGQTLKDIGFDGPAECQVAYDLGGAEAGADKITIPQQEVLGRLKRDRITVEQAFSGPWGLKVARPAFLERQLRAAEGAARPAAGPEGAPPRAGPGPGQPPGE